MSQELNDFVVNHKYEVKKDPTHGIVLVKDGQASRCHFQQPMPVAGALEGSFDLMFFPCSTRCTKAQIISKGTDLYYGQDCGTHKTAFKVEMLEDEKPQPKLSLVKN
jgi:hypothetical protein